MPIPQLPIAPEEPTRDESQWTPPREEQGFFDSLGAAFDLGVRGTAVMYWAKMSALKDLDNGATKLTPEELNKKYPGMPAPFIDSMNEAQAQFIHDQYLEDVELQQKINDGPDGWTQTISNFGAGMLAHMMDPIELGLGFIVGPAIGFAANGTKIGAALGVGSRAATGVEAAIGLKAVPTLAGASAKQKAAFAIVDGMAGNMLAEIPIMIASSKMLEDYTALDAFVSTAGGVLGFTGLRFAAGKGVKFIKNLNAPHQTTMWQIALSQMERFGRTNLAPYFEDVVSETNIRPADMGILNIQPYQYTKHVPGDGKKFYVATETSRPAFHMDEQGLMHESLVSKQDGIFLTDSDGVANGTAYRKQNLTSGRIYEANIEGANLLDMNTVTDGSQSIVRGMISKYPQLEDAIGLDTPIFRVADIVDGMMEANRISAKAAKDLIGEIKANGFDGFFHDGTSFFGHNHLAHNAVTVFRESLDKVNIGNEVRGRPDMVPQISRSEAISKADDLNSYKQKLEYDEELVKEIVDGKKNPVLAFGESELSGQAEELNNVFQLKKQSLVDNPRILKEFESVEARVKELDAITEAYDLADVCFGGL